MPDREQFDIWFVLNEMATIDAMLRNRNSVHWSTCSDFVQYYLEKQFPNLPPQLKEEVVQDALLSIYKALPSFRRESKFTTWVVLIARHRAIDVLRRLATIDQAEIVSDGLSELQENDIDGAVSLMPKTPEQVVLTNELMREAFAGIEAFLQMHRKSRRNRKILSMVMFDGLTQKETAQKLGIPIPVVGYIVRAARAYLHLLSEQNE